jgi:hypothetical protein
MTPCGPHRNHGDEIANARASCQPEIDLRFMARDPELSTPRRDAAQWAMDRIAASEARVEAAVRAGLEAAAVKCDAQAAITGPKAKKYTARGIVESAAVFDGAYTEALALADAIRALAADDAAVARIAKGIMP